MWKFFLCRSKDFCRFLPPKLVIRIVNSSGLIIWGGLGRGRNMSEANLVDHLFMSHEPPPPLSLAESTTDRCYFTICTKQNLRRIKLVHEGVSWGLRVCNGNKEKQVSHSAHLWGHQIGWSKCRHEILFEEPYVLRLPEYGMCKFAFIFAIKNRTLFLKLWWGQSQEKNEIAIVANRLKPVIWTKKILVLRVHKGSNNNCVI